VTYTDVSAVEVETARVVPLVRELVARGVTVSVDTWKAPVAEAALEAGAHLLNDVSGLRDPALADLAAACGAGLCVMHTRAAPKEKHFPAYEDVVADVRGFLAERLELARARGVRDEQLLLDPGPDFAKTPQQTVDVLRADWRPEPLPWLAAISRKYFLGAVTGRAPDERLAGTLAAAHWAADAGAAMVRVHDVREVADLLAVRALLRGEADVGAFDEEDDRLKWLRG
jgi:dihydropteroate synthase